MELRQLRYFVAVFTEGSISRAAGSLLISQPALTRQIRVLERELGTPLFDRVPTGVQATAAGRALHEHARQLLRLADATRETTRSAAPVKEQVEIALAPGIPQPWVLTALARVRRELPDAALSFLDASSTEQLRLLGEGRIDLGLIHQSPPSAVYGEYLFEHPFGVAIRPGHPLSGRPQCRLRDLDDIRVLSHARAQVPAGHDRMLAASHDLGVSPQWRFAIFSENALACAEAVEADAVLLSRHSAERLLPGWTWSELVEPRVPLTTWAVRQPQTRQIVGAVLALLADG